MDVLLHIGNVLFVVSYSVRDILTLRLVTVLATFALVGYYASFPEPLRGPIAWSVIFTTINGYHIVRLIRERRPVVLDLDARRLHRLVFASLPERAFKRLLDIGRWETVAPGARLVEQGHALAEVRVLLEGRARIEVDGRTVGALGPGQFVGEMSYLTGEPPSATVVIAEDTRCLAWPRDALARLLGTDEATRATMQSVIGSDLCGKLRGAARTAG